MNPCGTILLLICPICMAASVLDEEPLVRQGQASMCYTDQVCTRNRRFGDKVGALRVDLE